MTVPATTRRAGPFNGNGVTTSFPFTFKVFAAADLAVTLTDADAIESTLVLDSDYTVTLNGDQDSNPGGSVTYSTLAAGEKLTVVGAVDYDQQADLPTGGSFSPIVIENALDRATFQIQQLAEELGRSLTLPASAADADTTLPAPEAGKVIGWNDTATALVNLDSADLATVVIAGTAYTDTFDGTGAQVAFALTADPGSVNALDVAISGVSQVNGVDFTVSGTTLTFTSAPPAGTDNIAVRYVAAVPVGSANAQDVVFNPAGSGAVPTTAEVMLRRRVSVEDNGADPNGLTSSNTAFDNAALALLAQGGGDLHVGPGEFLLLNWYLPAGVRLVGAGRGRTKLVKNAGGAGTHVVRGAGTLGTTQALTANVTAGLAIVSVATSAAFSLNSYALVREATYVSGSAGRKQQVVRVIALTATTVAFAMPLLESYTTAASAEILPLTGVSDAGIYNLAIDGVNSTPAGGGVQIQHGIGFQMEDVHVRWFSDQAGVKFLTCYDSHAHNISARDGLNQAAGGYGYALEFDESTMLSSITGSVFENARETTFTNRTMLCRFAENRLIGNYDSGFNTHGAFVRHCVIEDNEVVGVQTGAGLAVGFGTHGAGDTDIVLRRNKVLYAGSVGISINAPVGKENARIEVDGNTVFQNGQSSTQPGILIQYASTVRSRDNVVDGNGSTTVSAGIYVLNSTDATFDDDAIRNLPNAYGFRYSDCTDLNVSNVSVMGVSSDNFRGAGTNVRAFINGKRVDDATETVGTGASHTGRIQTGRTALTFAAVSTLTQAITFPSAYPTGIVPVVTATPEDNLGVWRGALISTPTNTGFSVTLTDDGGTNRTGTAYVNWTAIG